MVLPCSTVQCCSPQVFPWCRGRSQPTPQPKIDSPVVQHCPAQVSVLENKKETADHTSKHIKYYEEAVIVINISEKSNNGSTLVQLRITGLIPSCTEVRSYDRVEVIFLCFINHLISTDGALRLPTTYDNHPIQPIRTHPHIAAKATSPLKI